MMKYAFLSSLALVAVVIISLPSFDFQAPPISDIQNFRLKNVDGRMVSMKDFPDAKGFIIIFTCNHCPFAKLYPPRLNALNAKYKPLGYPLIAISSTDTILYEEDTYPKMVEKATSEAFNFPYLFDETQSVAQNFKAQKTPHAYVLQKVKRNWVVRYNGAIDDNGGEPEAVTQAFVANAVDALLAGKEVAVKETKSIGCQIYFRKTK
ncbi:MAG: thioredoxin family protein [Saprospiraceae bacterium]|nr:thioredoxin family protein [Saprospiraceae bacterium]